MVLFFGRQFKEGDTLYADIRAKHAYNIITKYLNNITEIEKNTIQEIEKIKKQSGLKYWPFAD